MEKIKIGYFADGRWAHEAFKILIQDKSIEIKFICVRYDTTDTVLKEFAEQYHLGYLKNKNINSDEFLETVSKYDCDLFVSMSFNQIFKKRIMHLPKMKTINCHAGKLPFYRGRNILNWALINDEKEFGITVHYMDEGIDTGDIILQRTYPITDQDDYSTLLETAYIECAKILYDAIKLMQSNKQVPKKQIEIHPVGFYCGKRKPGDEKLNWNQTSREVFNFVRAICKPGPGARCILNDEEMIVNRVGLIAGAPIYTGIPGQIVGFSNDHVIVKTLDSTVEITEYDYPKRIRIGDRFE